MNGRTKFLGVNGLEETLIVEDGQRLLFELVTRDDLVWPKDVNEQPYYETVVYGIHWDGQWFGPYADFQVAMNDMNGRV